jgi:hypothetical protein
LCDIFAHFKKLGIAKLSDIFNIQLGKFLYAYSTGHLPQTLWCLFVLNAEIHQHYTRHRYDPHVVSRANSLLSKFLYMQSRRSGLIYLLISNHVIQSNVSIVTLKNTLLIYINHWSIFVVPYPLSMLIYIYISWNM